VSAGQTAPGKKSLPGVVGVLSKVPHANDIAGTLQRREQIRQMQQARGQTGGKDHRIIPPDLAADFGIRGPGILKDTV